MCLQKLCKPTLQVIHVNEMQFHCSQTEGAIIAKDRCEKCVNCCNNASNYEASSVVHLRGVAGVCAGLAWK